MTEQDDTWAKMIDQNDDIFDEKFFVLIIPLVDLSPVHIMTDLTDFRQIDYLKISVNNNMYTH